MGLTFRLLLEEELHPDGVMYKVTIRDIVMKDFGDVSYGFIFFMMYIFVQFCWVQDFFSSDKSLMGTGHSYLEKRGASSLYPLLFAK